MKRYGPMLAPKFEVTRQTVDSKKPARERAVMIFRIVDGL